MTVLARNCEPRQDVRHGVRALLTSAEGFQALDPDAQQQIASSLVRISSTALNLAEVAGKPHPSTYPRSVLQRPPTQAMAAGDEFSGAAVDRIAPTTQNILNAVSFPRFVAELITGVFKAMNDSNQQQLTAYVELIRNVAATTEGFADANVGISGVRAFLAERFPGSFVVQGDENNSFDDPSQMSEEDRAEWQAERDLNTRLVLRPGATMPSEEALRTTLGLSPGDSVPSGDPEALLGPARAAMARNRQQMLSTMVMMGLQRIVIDSGRLNASMRFHIDASSAATEDRGSRSDIRHTSEVGARAQFGPWGAAAKMQNTIGYVSTERTQTEESLNAELDLSSSVELIFRSDYVPLERLAGTGDVNRIRVNSINPSEEARLASEDRRARTQQRLTRRAERAGRLTEDLRPTPIPQSRTPLEVPEPVSGQTSTSQPTTGQPTTEQPTTGQPTTGQPTTGQPTTGQPTTGQPTTGQ
ncbi:MAG: hypothetical protein GY792_36280, partial [Gammaproteobacteria bacterium]|nr:hypothetical protein [Gammaproteobacteria bacterium]